MTSGKVPAKAFAVFAVALMLAVVVVPILSVTTETDAIDNGETEVTYHRNLNSSDTVTHKVSYYGIASAEYNPQYWIGTDSQSSKDGRVNWGAPSTVVKGSDQVLSLTINYGTYSDGKRFTLPDYIDVINIDAHANVQYEWQADDSVHLVNGTERTYEIVQDHPRIYSGYVFIQYTLLKEYNNEYVFVGWRTTADSNDPYHVDYNPGDIITGEKDLYAVWAPSSVYIQNNIQYSETITLDILSALPYGSQSNYDVIISPMGDNEYTRIYQVDDGDETGNYLEMGTYRSADVDRPSTFYIRETYNGGIDYHIPLNGNVIIDNVKLVTQSCDPSLSHGNDSDHGIFANGYRLIIGTNVSTDTMSENESAVARAYPQIFGGIASDTYNHASATARDSIPSTDLVIFSGVFYNIVAGNHDGNIDGDTHLVIRGGTVLDTVVGGNSSSTEGTANANVIRGSTYVYVLGGCLPADSYQEDKIGTSANTAGVMLSESTILTGGSNNGKVSGDTNVFISGNASLWDVQGGGRRGQSTVDGTVNVEVSGLAVIRHVLCGSITDGLDGKSGNGSPDCIKNGNPTDYKGSVHNVVMMVKHGAMVASVFGAGYDTYYKPLYSSMFGSDASIDTSIDIDIVGGIVGYVYGGGYRGAVGYTGDLSLNPVESPIDSISIEVSGSAKVLGDVYGGGRGGVDKVTHNGGDPGYDNNGGFEDSTGFAWTRVKSISIDISGNATIEGSVYGGGESVAILLGKDSRPGVAKVVAESITIEVGDQAKIDGTIYGSGRGVDVSSETALSASGTVTLQSEKDSNNSWTGRYLGKITEIPWYDRVPNYLEDTDYGNYAKVGDDSTRASITINTGSGTTIGNGTGDSSVFGAGGRAETYASSISLNLDGTFNGSVYGAGESAATDVSGTIDIVIGSGTSTTINGNVFGAGRDGETEAESITISVGSDDGYKTTIGGELYGAGMGSGATTTLDGSITIDILDAELSTTDTQAGVYGAGKSAETTVGDSISLSINGSTVHGDVFGAGQSADTTVKNNSTITITGTTVDGDVFGAGEEADNTQIGDRLTVSILGCNGSASKVHGDVYGAGKYGFTSTSNGIRIELGDGSPEAPVIDGSVFGGAMGVQGQSAVYSDRTVILNNASVGVSIYGGTRDGNDASSNSTQTNCQADILLYFGTVSQGVYGGGYQGTSYLDTYIYFGTPAFEAERPNTYTPAGLKVWSIYGGSYFDTTSTEPGEFPVLLNGNSNIYMGSGAISGNVFNGYSNVGGANAIEVIGDVFGQGSYSTISGTATVELDGYVQTSDDSGQMISSFQGIDELRIIDSRISVIGSSQGGNPLITEDMTFNDIGLLILQGGSEVIIHSEMNSVTEFSSWVSEGVEANEADYANGTCSNTLRLTGGAVALVLGPNNLGPSTETEDTGLVHGFTLLDRQVGDDYYGAFVAGSVYTRDDAGFLVKDGSGYSPAPVIEDANMKFWYIEGTTTIERTMTFESDNTTGSVNFNILRIGDEPMRYTGAYIDYNIQDSMYVSSSLIEGYGGAAPYFTMEMSGTSGGPDGNWGFNVSTHEYVDGSGWQVVSTDSQNVYSGSVNLSAKMHGDLVTTGTLGYVIIHLEEIRTFGTAEIPFHTIDITIRIFVDPSMSTKEIPLTITVVDGSATGYLVLPNMNNFYSYELIFGTDSANGVKLEDFTLSADNRHLGKNGWDRSPYLVDSITLGSDMNIDFGIGGVGNPVIRLDYSGGDVGEEGAKLTFTVRATSQTEGGTAYTYAVVVTLQDSRPVNIQLHYSGVGMDTNTYTVSLTTRDDGYIILSWTTGEGDGVTVPFGTKISNHPGAYAVKWVDEGGEQKIQYCVNLSDALQALVDNILPVELNESDEDMFDYREFFSGWYTDVGMKNKFNLSSPVSQDIHLYAKFGVTVTFDFGNNEPVYDVVLPAGTTLHDNYIYNYFERLDPNGEYVEQDGISVIGLKYFTGESQYEGHYLVNSCGWVPSKDSNHDTRYSFDQKLISNITLYMNWEEEVYELVITVQTGTNSSKFEDSDYSVTGAQSDNGYNDGKMILDVEYGSTVSLSLLNGFHVKEVGSNNALSSSVSDSGVSFVIRDAGENGMRISITMIVSDAMTVIIEFTEVDGYTSALDGSNLSYAVGSTTDTVSTESVKLEDIGRGSKLFFSVAKDYTVHYWVNGLLKTEYVVGDDINPIITVCVVKNVYIESFKDMGIASLQLQRVQIPSVLNSGWSYASAVTIDADPEGGYKIVKVAENDRFSIQAEAGYFIPDGYKPENTDIVTVGSVQYFAVNGEGNVIFTALSKSDRSVEVNVIILDSEGSVASDVSRINGWTLEFTLAGQLSSLVIGFENNHYTVFYDPNVENPTYGYSIDGFESASGVAFDGSESIEIRLSPIEYTVVFHSLDGVGNGGIVTTEWDVLDSLGFPAYLYTEDGETEYATVGDDPIVVELANGDQPKRFVDTDGNSVLISHTDFDSSRVMNLTAVHKGQQDMTVNDDTTYETIVLRASEVDPDEPLDVGVLFDRDVTLTMSDGAGHSITVTYSAMDMTLSFSGDVGGTGLFTATADGYCLYVYVVADGEALL